MGQGEPMIFTEICQACSLKVCSVMPITVSFNHTYLLCVTESDIGIHYMLLPVLPISFFVFALQTDARMFPGSKSLYFS